MELIIRVSYYKLKIEVVIYIKKLEIPNSILKRDKALMKIRL